MSSLIVALLAGQAVAGDTFAGNVYYVGDIHSHTKVSRDAGAEGDTVCTSLQCGVFEDILDTARDNGLDFVAFSDHTNAPSAASDEAYTVLTDLVLAGHAPETGLVTIPAAEIALDSGGRVLGHRTLLFFGSNEEIDGLTRADTTPDGSRSTVIPSCDTLWTWMTSLTASFGPALLVPHHPASSRPSPTDWGCHSDVWEPVVEVYSVHGNSMGDGAGFDPMPVEVATGTVHTALDPLRYAHPLGFAGGTDRHDTLPGEVCLRDQMQPTHQYGGGLTIAVVPEGQALDRPALYDAFVDRRVYATSGPPVPVAVTYSAEGVLAGLGEDLHVDRGMAVTTSVSVPLDWAHTVDEVLLWRPSGSLALEAQSDDRWAITLDADELGAWVYVEVRLDGDAIWGSAGCDDGGTDTDERLWISPSQVTVFEDEDDDGFTTRGGDCDDADPALYPGAPDTPYDGVVTDCDGTDEFDADRDGEDALAFGGTDCDDADPDIFSGAEDLWYDGVDADCDGASDYDADRDGHDAEPWGDDCHDGDASVHPDAWDVPYDGVISDCDASDELDVDRDGHHAADHGGDDCDDTRADVNPSVTERWYSGVDEDCDGNDQDRDGDGTPVALDCDDDDPTRTADCSVTAEGCGCGTRGPAGAPWLFAAGLLALGFRRSWHPSRAAE